MEGVTTWSNRSASQLGGTSAANSVRSAGVVRVTPRPGSVVVEQGQWWSSDSKTVSSTDTPGR
ncbi:MAG TPA: hypothetical protein VGI05_17435, partial [Streptosporangiaceae bacterium]